MLFRSIITTFLTLLAIHPAMGQDYEVVPPPDQIAEDRLSVINIVTKAEMELGDLPKHPKITWLGYSSIRQPRFYRDPGGELRTENKIFFIANSPGLLEFPPIPLVLENKEFFIRLDDIRVTRNKTPLDDTRFEVFWNGEPEPPKTGHLGEAIEIQFIQLIALPERRPRYSVGPAFSELSHRVIGGQWHQFVRQDGRKPFPSDYYYSYGRGFFGGRFENFKESERIIGDRPHRVRIHKARLYLTKVGTTSGHLSATLGTTGTYETLRTHVVPFSIKVDPLPPIPNQQAFDTRLIGDFTFNASVTPSQPAEGKPLTISLDIYGKGNPNLRNELNFAAEGFPSGESNLEVYSTSNYLDWEANFTQSLYPTGKVGTLPAVTIAHFDTVEDEWKFQEITPSLTLAGFTDVVSSLSPRTSLGNAVQRPVLLNLPVATFGAFALAPFLPFLFGFVRKRLDGRDPEKKKRERELHKLVSEFKSGNGSEAAIDDRLLPILRHRLDLPPGATAREIADALPDEKLADLLRAHAESSFSSEEKKVDYKALAQQLGKLSLLLLLTIGSIRGATLEEANQAFENSNYSEAVSGYKSLIEEDPGRPTLYFNLAQAYLSANDVARARAATQTSLLLNPLDQEARDLMAEIRNRQGDSTVSRSRFLELRPDQWLILAAIFWVVTFGYFGIKKLRPLPRWPGFALLVLSLVLVGTAAWRQHQYYAPDQYMVLADELPREPKAGTPDWDFPPLRAGQVVQVAEIDGTHARIANTETTFWLPVRELEKIW